MKTIRKNKLYLLNILIALVTGGSVYIIFRKDTYIASFFWAIFPVDISIPNVDLMSIRFIRNYLGDILWAYALTISLWLAFDKTNLYRTSIVSFLFCVFCESLQKIEALHGTFDVMDIITEGITVGIAAFVINLIKKNEGEEK